MDTVLLLWLACSASFGLGWAAHAVLAARREGWLLSEWPEESTVIDLQDATTDAESASGRERYGSVERPEFPTLRR